jgi:hypothetical protein
MRARLKPFLGAVLAVVLFWSLWNGYSRGGQDFRVFHYAGRLVLEGRWDALYTEGPDRYLYAPGFAFLIAPLAAIPVGAALAIWLGLTLTAFGAAMRMLAKRTGVVPVLFAILFAVRPLAIDLRYGQVNLMILSASVWALLTWFGRDQDRKTRRALGLSWLVFAMAAFAKIYPLALFLFPALALFRGDGERRSRARIAFLGAGIGAAVLLIPPLFMAGIYPHWFDALARKGLPTGPHNQSFLAALVRIFRGEPFYALGLGGVALRFPGTALSLSATRMIWLFFAATMTVALAFLAGRKEPNADRTPLIASLGLALCFLPAHLIWKSYFVLGIPLWAALFHEAEKDPSYRRRIIGPAIVLGGFLAFTSGDFIGARASAWIEATSPFLWVHLIAIVMGFWRLSSRARLSS